MIRTGDVRNMFYVNHCYIKAEGCELFTVVCLPDKTGAFPVVVMRTPYVDAEETLSEEEICRRKAEEFADWLEKGYAIVFQHCRGRGKSSGDCVPYIYEREDGLLLQDWIRRQPFYDGELYLCGSSYTASVHFVTAPFAEDIKGAVLQVQDSERYNCLYRNGFFKAGLHGGWYVDMYKKKSIRNKNYSPESFNILPLSDFSKTVFGERAPDLDEALRHPDRNDPFWLTRYGGGEARGALVHARIPVLLVTGFYDIYTGGVFDMWRALDDQTRSVSALAVHPFDHGCSGKGQPVNFENGDIKKEFGNYALKWFERVRKKSEPPFEPGRVTYYKLFGGQWRCDTFYDAERTLRIPLGEGAVSYRYDPNDPASFKGGLSANFGGNAWQDEPGKRSDIVSLFTPEFTEDAFVKGGIKARLKVRSSCEDTCFYMRLSLCKKEGYYGLRDDIAKISDFDPGYIPGKETVMDFSFDEHAFVIKKGEKLRIDISSSAFGLYVRHTNRRGLFSEQTSCVIAENTVIPDGSFVELPIKEERKD